MNITLLLIPLVFLCAGMAGAWALQRRTGNSGWIDTAWSALSGLAALIAVGLAGGFSTARGILAGALVLVWALRLAAHIGMRSHGAQEDPRYAELMTEWGAEASSRLFWFLQIQALAAFVLAVSVWSAATSGPLGLTSLDLVAVVIAVIAIVGEAIADRQLVSFKSRNKTRGEICEAGLWSWSRHPNYFFEWLYWCAWPVMAFGSGQIVTFVVASLAAVMMYWLLVHVSGIPPLEKHMLASRGERFRDYQRRVSAFFPLPPRQIRSQESVQ